MSKLFNDNIIDNHSESEFGSLLQDKVDELNNEFTNIIKGRSLQYLTVDHIRRLIYIHKRTGRKFYLLFCFEIDYLLRRIYIELPQRYGFDPDKEIDTFEWLDFSKMPKKSLLKTLNDFNTKVCYISPEIIEIAENTDYINYLLKR